MLKTKPLYYSNLIRVTLASRPSLMSKWANNTFECEAIYPRAAAAGHNRSYWNPSILIDFTLKYKSSSCFFFRDRQPDQTPAKNRVHLVCRVSDNLPNAQGECPMTPFCIRTVNLSDSVSIIAFFLPEIEMRGNEMGLHSEHTVNTRPLLLLPKCEAPVRV